MEVCVRSFDWLSAAPVLPTSPGFFNIFILLSQTGANGMCGQDFRIHHWLAEELAWAPCITCQSCQACCLPRFIIALALCCLSPLCARFSPARNHGPRGGGGGERPYHAPQCHPRSAATKLGYTVVLLEIRKRSGRSFCLPKMLSETSDSPSLLLSFHSSSSL